MRPIELMVAAAAALAVAGCGDGEGDTASKPTPAKTATPTPTPAATTAASAQTTVKIVDFEYEPKAVTVKAGSRITWENEDATNHTVSFKKGPGDIGNVDPRKKLKAGFDTPGRLAYVCQYHPNMKGTVVVQ